MSDSPEGPWSNNPNAPQISYSLYLGEKQGFAGTLVGSLLYGGSCNCLSDLPTFPTQSIVSGVVVVLFFRCMDALLNPVGRTKGNIQWGLVAHTVVMFSSATIYTAINLDLQSISSIDNREFTGDGGLFPGPLGYQFFINSKPITIVPDILIFLNGWLADGLLACDVLKRKSLKCPNTNFLLQLYRCYVIYAMNYWVIAFPCLMFLASLGTYSPSFLQVDRDTYHGSHHRCSDGHCAHLLPGLGTVQCHMEFRHPRLWLSILRDFLFAQRHSHPDDSHTTHPAQ